MSENNNSPLFRFIKWSVKQFSPRYKLQGEENLPEEPAVIVGNHSQMYGPIASEIYHPRDRRIWCAGQMMKMKEVPAYAYKDFWSGKPRAVRWFYKLLSYVIAPLSAFIFTHAATVPVYHDGRLITTFRRSLDALCDGKDIVIFPEHAEPYNDILCDFQDKFVDLARMYHKRTGKRLNFVPMYLAPRLELMTFCEPVAFSPDAPIKEERARICVYCMDKITETARSFPRHTVVPYLNIPKRDYPENIPEEVGADEKTAR